uniref:uncharacterized protein LOC112436092 isoform X1 n=1 Tax=Maylandia zebra TaxID=106582 RepID=UPI000D2F669A|nr:uncharacterized protein LOC112436092 isoform X1 [Maylandia zebra]
MYIKKTLWKHALSCKSKKLCASKTRHPRVQGYAARLLPIKHSSKGCQTIIDNMRQDQVSFHIRSDSLICKYGESLYARHGRVKSKHQYIAQRMRELGRLILAAKNMDRTVNVLEDLCKPSKFQFVVSVAKHLANFSPGKNEYGKPSTAVKIGFCLKGAVEVLIGQTLMNDDDYAEKKAKKFLELLDKNWRNSVSVSAHQTIQEKRWNKPDDIPLTKNVIALRDHLRTVEGEARESLMQHMDLAAYKALNETVLAQVIVFNKRREGEASRLTLQTYKNVKTSPINEDIYETLSPLEKELSKLLTRIEIRGKRGRKVPVFLSDRMKESIDLLVKNREAAGVPAENPYLFARPGGMTHIRGCDCLRKYANQSKAENPELLRSTKLRKQVATLCQLLDLNDQELEQVARFMGHDIRVHQDFYRQTDKTFQIAKISKLLFAMEGGAGTLRGKNLSTLEVSVAGVISPAPSPPASQRDPGRLKEQDTEVDENNNVVFASSDDGCSDSGVTGESPIAATQSDPQGNEEEEKGGGSEMDEGQIFQIYSIERKKISELGRCGTLIYLFFYFFKDDSSQHFADVNEETKEVTLAVRKRGKTKVAKAKEIPRAKVKKPWSEAEKTAVQRRLGKFVAERKVPKKEHCMKCLEAEKDLANRSWKDVKNFVYNTIVTLNRRSACKKLF